MDLLAFLKLMKKSKQILAVLQAAERSNVGMKFFTTGPNLKRIVKMNLKVTQKLPLSITISDRFGNAAPVDGVPEWSLTNPAAGSLSVAADGMSAELTPSGVLGDVSVHVNADADLGEGVKTIAGELPVSMIAGDAEVVSIAAGLAV